MDEIMEIPPTTQPPPPPPLVQLPEIVEISNEEIVLDEIELNLDLEMTENTSIEQTEYKAPEMDEPQEEEPDKIFSIVEEQAEPVGGVQAFYRYVGSQLKDNYPPTAERMNIKALFTYSLLWKRMAQLQMCKQ